jgi:hypothetical protein
MSPQDHLAAVEVEEDDDRQPGEPLVPLHERMVTRQGVQERGRLQLDRRVGVLCECAGTRPRYRGVEQPEVTDRSDPECSYH